MNIMATETDPLTTGASINSSKESDALDAYAKHQAAALAHMITDGSTSIRTLALLGGIAMTISSTMGIWHRLFSFQWISAIVGFYTLLLGVVVIIFESKSGKCYILTRRYTNMWETQLRKYALFLSFVSGRGALYFVAGTLQLSQLSLVDLAVGGYMAAVGVMYILVGKQTSRKLSYLRKSALSEDILRKRFNDADTAKSGRLTFAQFQDMLSTGFGLEFSIRELKESFGYIDSVGRDSKVTTIFCTGGPLASLMMQILLSLGFLFE